MDHVFFFFRKDKKYYFTPANFQGSKVKFNYSQKFIKFSNFSVQLIRLVYYIIDCWLIADIIAFIDYRPY